MELEFPSFEILISPCIHDRLKHRNDSNSNRFPSSQLCKLPPHRPPPGSNKFNLTLFSLSFHSHFFFSLRTVYANFPCPEKRINSESRYILDPHLRCFGRIWALTQFLLNCKVAHLGFAPKLTWRTYLVHMKLPYVIIAESFKWSYLSVMFVYW